MKEWISPAAWDLIQQGGGCRRQAEEDTKMAAKAARAILFYA